MNKQIIVLIALVVAVFAAPASADTLEVRGTIAELNADNPTLTDNTPAGDWYSGYRWDYSTFAGFWYDPDDNLETETLTILSGLVVGDTVGPLNYATNQRTIGNGRLVYTTHPVFHEYELHENEADPDRTTQTAMEAAYDDLLDQPIGLCVDSDNPGGDCGYFLEGWMGEAYVAIDDNADKLCKLLVEFKNDEAKSLYLNDKWDLGGGFDLELTGVGDNGDKATLQLSKNGIPLEGSLKCIDTRGSERDRVYTYNEDIGDEWDIPVFSCYVDWIFKGGDVSYVRLMYVFLIDDDVLEIDTGDTFGAMEVMTASTSGVVLRNDETTIDLDMDTTEHIMGDMYFKTADDGAAIRFYPFIERTIGGEEPTPPPATIPANDTDGDGVPDAWDEEADTPAGYWVNSDGIGRRWGDMNGDGKLTSVDALMILQAAVGGASAQSIAIKTEDGGSLPDSILVGETFTVLITDDGSPVGTGTNVMFRLPYDTGDPVYLSTDDNGKVRYKPLVTGTLGIRVLDGTVTVAEATVEVI